jgi:hypothetical protein
MTTEYDFAFSRRDASEFFIKPTLNGGSGECRVRAAPAVSRAKLCKEAHTSIQVQRKHSGIPHAMALRLMARSPRRRIRLVTVAGGLRCNEIPVGLAHLRRLDTSNGCRNHTLLPYASTPFVCMLVTTHRQSPPCDSIFMRDAAASTTSHPAFVTIMIRPSFGKGPNRYIADLGSPSSKFLKIRNAICPSPANSVGLTSPGIALGRKFWRNTKSLSASVLAPGSIDDGPRDRT